MNWYRLEFNGPFFSLVLIVSAVLMALVPMLASDELDYSKYVGADLFLLSLAILLPLAFRANTANGLLPFPAAPFVALNFLYFVLGTFVPLMNPDFRFRSMSLPEVPRSMLFLAVGFAFFAAGTIASGKKTKTWALSSRDVVSVNGMEILVVVAAAAIWVLRLYLASRGFGITHASDMLALPTNIEPLAVAVGQLQYVPLCLCLVRLCSTTLTPRKFGAWRNGLVAVLASDTLYFLAAGARLGLLCEWLTVLWAIWLGIIPGFSRRWFAYGALVLALAVPLVYAQRDALKYVSFTTGVGSHVELARDLLPEEARSLHDSSARLSQSLSEQADRFTAIGQFSAIADRTANDDYPFMWGKTLWQGLPFLLPRVFWPSKPVALTASQLIELHFGLLLIDDLGTIETEALANFGVAGLCVWMFLFGLLTNAFFFYLIKTASSHEPVTFCLLYALQAVFTVETSITGVLATTRFVPALFILLMLLSVRRRNRGFQNRMP